MKKPKLLPAHQSFTSMWRSVRNLATTVDPKAKTASKSRVIYDFTRESISQNKPHFTPGNVKLYFPSARVTLLRPNAKHTPYQAKFAVPKSFNKLDLRDYLYSIYGLRVFNVTTQLIHGRFSRALPMPFRSRRRLPQIKKMTVDMEEPFVWPEPVNNFFEMEERKSLQERKYFNDKTGHGSDRNKKSDAFDGIVDSTPPAQSFITSYAGRKLKNTKTKDMSNQRKQEEENLILKYVDI